MGHLLTLFFWKNYCHIQIP